MSSKTTCMSGAIFVAKAKKPEKVIYKAQAYDLLVSNSLPKPNFNAQTMKNKVLVKVKSAAINPVDTKFLPPFGPSKTLPVLRDFSGIVEDISENANNRDLKIGDAVMGMTEGLFGGACGQYLVTDLSKITRKPENVSFEKAAGLGVCYFTGYDGIFAETPAAKNQKRQPPNENSSILIIGSSGGTGMAGLQLAKNCAKANLVVGVCSGKNADFCRENGADKIIDYTKSEEIDFKSLEILEMIKKNIELDDKFEGFDLIYDCVTSPEDFNYRDISTKYLLAPKGHYFCINGTSGMWMKAMATKATGLSWFMPKNQDLYIPSATAEKMDQMSRWMEEGKLDIKLNSVYDFRTGKKVGEKGCEKIGDKICLNQIVEEQCSRRAVGKIVVTNIN